MVSRNSIKYHFVKFLLYAVLKHPTPSSLKRLLRIFWCFNKLLQSVFILVLVRFTRLQDLPRGKHNLRSYSTRIGKTFVNCEQSLFCSKIRGEERNERAPFSRVESRASGEGARSAGAGSRLRSFARTTRASNFVHFCSVFCVLSRGLSSKRENARSLDICEPTV